MSLPVNQWWLVALIALGLHSGYMLNRFSNMEEQMELQNQVLSERISLQEAALNSAAAQTAQTAVAQAGEIDALYNSAVAELERLHNSSSSAQKQVPGNTAGASRTQQASSGRSPEQDKAMAQKLLKCEHRLLYEAREHDILATHYNALLSIYNNTRKTLNDNRKD